MEGSPKEHRNIHLLFSSLPTCELLFSRYQDPKLQAFHKLCVSFHICCRLQERPSEYATHGDISERGGSLHARATDFGFNVPPNSHPVLQSFDQIEVSRGELAPGPSLAYA